MPFECGIQTGAGATLNALRPPAGSSVAIFGTGTVGIAAITAITGGGADFCVETTGVSAVLRTAVDASAPTGVTGAIGAPAFGNEVASTSTRSLPAGWAVRRIVEGDSVPEVCIPRLVELATAPLPGRVFDPPVRLRSDRGGGA